MVQMAWCELITTDNSHQIQIKPNVSALFQGVIKPRPMPAGQAAIPLVSSALAGVRNLTHPWHELYEA